MHSITILAMRYVILGKRKVSHPTRMHALQSLNLRCCSCSQRPSPHHSSSCSFAGLSLDCPLQSFLHFASAQTPVNRKYLNSFLSHDFFLLLPSYIYLQFPPSFPSSSIFAFKALVFFYYCLYTPNTSISAHSKHSLSTDLSKRWLLPIGDYLFASVLFSSIAVSSKNPTHLHISSHINSLVSCLLQCLIQEIPLHLISTILHPNPSRSPLSILLSLMARLYSLCVKLLLTLILIVCRCQES